MEVWVAPCDAECARCAYEKKDLRLGVNPIISQKERHKAHARTHNKHTHTDIQHTHTHDTDALHNERCGTSVNGKV